MQKGKVNNNFFIVIAITFILLCLSLINIDNITSTKSVLGAHSQIEHNDSDFWEKFIGDNPNYIPGLIENGNIDEVRQINPNFEGI